MAIQTVVGISFRPTSDERIQVGSPIQIVHDKSNQYSSRAIAVQFDGKTLGYIGEKGNLKHEQIFNVLPLEAKVVTISRLGSGEVFAKFKEGEITHLEVEFAMPSDKSEKTKSFEVKSFNEDISLTFLKEEHKYIYNEVELLSGTRYIKRWIAEFDETKIADLCANKYGCTAEEVLAFWEGGGDVASAFGTSIHNAMEHYEKFKWLGEIVQNQKGLPFNKALPTHPLLRKIVEDFYKQDLQPGEVVSEALLTNVERGLCGYADRILITGEKRCRVQDFKVNVGADKVDSNIKFLGQMAELPKTKLTKYQLQMSFYARLLQLSGWTVEGLDAFVFDDITRDDNGIINPNAWKHYELEMVTLDF